VCGNGGMRFDPRRRRNRVRFLALFASHCENNCFVLLLLLLLFYCVLCFVLRASYFVLRIRDILRVYSILLYIIYVLCCAVLAVWKCVTAASDTDVALDQSKSKSKSKSKYKSCSAMRFWNSWRQRESRLLPPSCDCEMDDANGF